MRSHGPALLVAVLLAGCGPTPSTHNTPTLPTTPATSPAAPPTDKPKPHPATGGCHPGCFPARTIVNTPSGPREVQTIRAGDTVTLIEADGRATSGPVVAVFDTCNELVEVRTDGGTLTTTAKQPLCLGSGGCKPAGELASGDVIWRWVNDERKAVTVNEVVATGRHVAVYNLVVGEGKVFVANGFLAKGKPPVTP